MSDTASTIKSDLRPIALTCTLAKVMEGFVRDRLVDSVSVDLDPRQYARAGYSTTDALVYLLQAIYEAVDRGNCGARLFLADFSKGFDLIDHEILTNELQLLQVHRYPKSHIKLKLIELGIQIFHCFSKKINFKVFRKGEI